MKESKLFSVVFHREFMKVIRKPSFWISTLLLPVLFLGLNVISAVSSSNLDTSVDLSGVKNDKIIIVDQAGVVAPEFLHAPFIVSTDETESIERVKGGEVDAALIYPTNVLSEHKVKVYADANNVTDGNRYDGLAKEVLRQSVLRELGDPNKIAVVAGNVEVANTTFANGSLAKPITSYIAPALFLAAFFMLIVLSTNYLILALSEEKENRISEIMLTILKPRTLLVGKIAAFTAIGITQLALIASLATLVAVAMPGNLPSGISLSGIVINIPQLALSLAYLLLGYFMLATIMAGTGALMPSAREAANFSGFFIFLAISPLYFFGVVLTHPNGPLAMVLSYIPFTAPFLLLIRNALGVIPAWEALLSVAALVLYVAGGTWLAVRLYVLGSLEYQDKLGLRKLITRWRTSKG